MTAASYPYTGVLGECRDGSIKDKDKLITVPAYRYAAKYDPNSMIEFLKYQPLIVLVAAS